MNQCKYCDKELPEISYAAFCPFCGRKYPVPTFKPLYRKYVDEHKNIPEIANFIGEDNRLNPNRTLPCIGWNTFDSAARDIAKGYYGVNSYKNLSTCEEQVIDLWHELWMAMYEACKRVIYDKEKAFELSIF